MQKTVKSHDKNVPYFSRLLRSIFSSPYDNYTPSPTLPSFDFGKSSNVSVAKTPSVSKPVIVLPENVTEKITSVGVKYEKKTETGTSIEFEVWGEKKALLTESEMNEVLQKFPKIDKTAIVITKRAWAKNMTVSQTIGELKKQNLPYSQTYIKVMRSIFNKMG